MVDTFTKNPHQDVVVGTHALSPVGDAESAGETHLRSAKDTEIRQLSNHEQPHKKALCAVSSRSTYGKTNTSVLWFATYSLGGIQAAGEVAPTLNVKIASLTPLARSRPTKTQVAENSMTYLTQWAGVMEWSSSSR